MELVDWRERTIVDALGEKLGKVADVYLDEPSGRPQWALVRSGVLRHREYFVPIDDVQLKGSELHIPFSKDEVESAPRVDAGDSLSIGAEAELAAHYGRSFQVSDGRLTYGPAAGIDGSEALPAPPITSAGEPDERRRPRGAADTPSVPPQAVDVSTSTDRAEGTVRQGLESPPTGER